MKDRITRMCPVILSDEEFEAKASELAVLERELQELRAAKKAAAADYGSKIEATQGAINVAASIVERRSEIREVDCVEEVSLQKKIVEIFRADTGELVDTRGITNADIQRALPMDITADDDKSEA